MQKELWEYDLRQGSVKKSTPKNSGCEDYYHSFDVVDGTRDDESIEQSFRTIENKLPKLFEAIRNRQAVSVRVWSTLFLFAALQRSRCPKFLHSFRKGLSEVHKRMYEIWKHSPDFEETMLKRGMDPDKIRNTKFDITADRGTTLLLLLSSFRSGNLTKLFAKMKWAFLVAPPDRYFFTSDDPLCCWAAPDKRGPLGSIGPASAGVEITFPLSRRVCAFAHWESAPPELYYPTPSDKVDAINYRTVVNGWRFVYGPANDARILGIVEEVAKSSDDEEKAESD